MLYLGIDQHARQITISLRDENGDVVQARQVSTRPEKITAFFDDLTRRRAQNDESFVAVLEVCGFNDWLIEMLQISDGCSARSAWRIEVPPVSANSNASVDAVTCYTRKPTTRDQCMERPLR